MNNCSEKENTLVYTDKATAQKAIEDHMTPIGGPGTGRKLIKLTPKKCDLCSAWYIEIDNE